MASTAIVGESARRVPIRSIVWGAVLLGLVAGLIWWRMRPSPPPLVRTARVALSALEVPFVVDGEVDAPRTGVAPAEMTRVVRILVREGDRVARGQRLAELDSRDSGAALTEAVAARNTALAERDRVRRAVAAAVAVAKRRLDVADSLVREAVARHDAVLAPARAELLGEAQARLESANAVVRSAEADADRLEALFADGAVSRADLDRAIARRDSARAESSALESVLRRVQAGASAEERSSAVAAVSTARRSREEMLEALRAAQVDRQSIAVADARVRAAGAAVERAMVRGADRWLLAPFAGRIARVHVEPGAMVGPGTPVVSEVDPGKFTVVASVPDDQSGLVSVGQAVDVAVPAVPGRRFAGRVVAVAPAAELRIDTAGRVRAVRARVRLTNPPPELVAGMEVDVSGSWRMPRPGLVVPGSALVYGGSGPKVWRVRGGTVASIEVETGLGGPDGTVVRGDLLPGDRVVSGAKEGLRDGMAVREAGAASR